MAEPLMKIEVDAKELLAALARLGDKAEQHVKQAAHETALAVQREAKARARRATGQLIESITVDEADQPLGGYRVFSGEMGTRAVEFPLWHEFGTKKMTAQPFMGPAVALEEGAHMRRIEEAIAEAIDGEGLGE